MDAFIPLSLQGGENFFLFEILRHRHREGDDEARVAMSGCECLHAGIDLIRCVARHRLAAVAAEKM